MGAIVKLILFFVITTSAYTVYNNFKDGHPLTIDSLAGEFEETLSLFKEKGRVIGESATQNSGHVLGKMTNLTDGKDISKDKIMSNITNTLTDEFKNIPYNICKSVIENYESH